MTAKWTPKKYAYFVEPSEEDKKAQKKRSGTWKRDQLPQGMRRKPRRKK